MVGLNTNININQDYLLAVPLEYSSMTKNQAKRKKITCCEKENPHCESSVAGNFCACWHFLVIVQVLAQQALKIKLRTERTTYTSRY